MFRKTAVNAGSGNELVKLTVVDITLCLFKVGNGYDKVCGTEFRALYYACINDRESKDFITHCAQCSRVQESNLTYPIHPECVGLLIDQSRHLCVTASKALLK